MESTLHKTNAVETEAQRMEQLWDLRLAGLVDEAYDEYLAWTAELGGDEALESAALSADLKLNLKLLRLSFLRNRRRFQELRTGLEALEKWMTSENLRPCERVLLQQGLNELGFGHAQKALEKFVAAKRKAQNPREASLSAFNAILCMEDLGLSYTQHLAQFEKDFASHSYAPWAASIRSQLDALRLRAAFKRSDFREIRRLLAGELEGEQARYHAAWLAKLPYMGLSEETHVSGFSSYLSEHGFAYLSHFRLRTLSTLLVAEDCHESVRLGEKVERLYLWTWLWLVSPRTELLERLLILRNDVEKNRGQTLSAEEFQLLRLSQLWLALFAGGEARDIDARLQGFVHAVGHTTPHLEVEAKLLEMLFAERDSSPFAADTRASLRLDPLLPRHPLFQALLEGGETETKLQGFTNSLESFRRDDKEARAVVELLHGRVRLRNDREEEILSPSIAQFLACFQRKDVADKQEILRQVWGLRRYDAFVHDPKLANLFTRANKYFQGIAEFSAKGDKVYASIDRRVLRFHGWNDHSRCFLEIPGFRESLLGREDDSLHTGENLGEFDSRWFTRGTLETKLGVSKATCARLLQSWREEGLLEAEGGGKNLRYRGGEKFLEKLSGELSKRRAHA